MSKFTIRTKLLSAFFLILLATSAVNIYSLVEMNMLADLTTSMYDHPLQVTRAVLKAETGIVEMHRDMKDVVLAEDETALQTAINSVDEHEQEVLAQFAIVQEWILGSEGDKLAADALQDFKAWKSIRDEVIQLTQDGKTAEAVVITKGKGADHVETLMNDMEDLKSYAAEKATGMLNDAQATRDRVIATAIIVLILAVLGSAAGGYWLSHGISRNIRRVVNATAKLAEGDLTLEIDVKSGDEVGEMAEAMNTVLATWRQIIGRLRNDSARLSTTAAEVASSSEELSRTTTTQSDEISRTSSAIEEMAATIREVASSAERAAQSATNNNRRANDGMDIVSQTSSQLEEADQIMQRLKSRSDEIGAIVNLIQDVAAQTNILALNAAIEAAGAGAAGARFDVVAEEIRKLAGRTSEATGNITQLISAIQSDTQNSAAAISRSAAMAQKSGAIMAGIVEESAAVNDMIQNISSSTEQQSRSSDEIASALDAVVGSSQQTVVATRETAQVGVELSNLAERLKDAADQFKV